jgi:N6-L-threonylcarbamoyladenine synthase
MDRLAQAGNPRAHDFPRPMVKDAHDDFSFSGLKTSVRYFLRDHPETLESEQSIRDVCASVQSAIVDVLVQKTIRAARRIGVTCVTASGGVTCNRALRSELQRACDNHHLKLLLAEPKLCTDNAGMIGILAERKLLQRNSPTNISADIRASWALA